MANPLTWPSFTGITVRFAFFLCKATIALAVKNPIAEPTNTSEAQWSLSLILPRAVRVAILYANGEIHAIPFYSDAITVAIEKTNVESADGKER